ncbi:MAG: DUF5615 family PIN-like protein [Cyclobacteriaceae bacterium]|nr:DUF5615 family PIN-like protein [Cyclobacteriaceae bacterium]
MALLFDQNISFRILKSISEDFPGSKQVREVGLEEKTDFEIWNWAKSNTFTIVTFDADFVDLSLLYKSPPKVIWLRIGNSSTRNIAQVIKSKKTEIEEFLSNSKDGILKIESDL